MSQLQVCGLVGVCLFLFGWLLRRPRPECYVAPAVLQAMAQISFKLSSGYVQRGVPIRLRSRPLVRKDLVKKGSHSEIITDAVGCSAGGDLYRDTTIIEHFLCFSDGSLRLIPNGIWSESGKPLSIEEAIRALDLGERQSLLCILESTRFDSDDQEVVDHLVTVLNQNGAELALWIPLPEESKAAA